ncbi:metalloregulator ArsR/SmtB family transcription factor [Corynebacterium sp. YIM 101645]|uniref:Metalloregulator ArsR/SmtB family transcription factor n=1 Tax=Corynebacterium lemuris TaxID=1859292 RepID=A0ABT2FZ82_9CORY|nr:metalloregulator ArsR/SmtB family transcription factor [Corynebacterium lemuris]MCS5480570.1 metalloregulator ArsR/SmtB family transcription factor [Corynebacterium lemuris]
MSTVTLPHISALSWMGHALSDDTRTGILLALRHGPARPSELARQLAVSKQVMSNQLACLRGCGLVVSTPQGRNVWYSLADPRLGHALGELLELVVTIDPTCCSPDGCTCS